MTGDPHGQSFDLAEPLLEVSVPGRVNLIGEHIDYAGLSVLPMAVQHRITVLLQPRRDAVVRVENTDGRFDPLRFSVSPDIPPYPLGHWGNYVKAAVQHLERRYGGVAGFDARVASTLPPAMGLSSSSALVVGVGLGALAAVNREIPPLELADELAEAERYVGTRGGGMDQAICLVAKAGHASRIDFDPLDASAIPVPDRWRFIIASSLVSAEKSGRVQAEYNNRRQDVEVAVQAVAGHVGAPGQSLRRLLRAHHAKVLIEASAGLLPDRVHRRFRHVVSEASRVAGAQRALVSDDAVTFGALMQHSHESLRDDFVVSSPELDAIVDIAQMSGAAGARLTGAGFGGCAVVLASPDAVSTVCDALVEGFYGPRGAEDVATVLFVADPSAGARVRALR
jgi:galactokinase